MKKNVNIKDIARIAGVGVTTVSRVINNHADVKKETRENILDIINEYNYIPNNSARNLKRSETKTIGVLVKGIYNPFFSRIVRVIEMEIAKFDYAMILHYNPKDCTSSDTNVATELIKEKKLSGLICLGGSYDITEDHQIEELETPIVLCSAVVSGGTDRDVISSVCIDDNEASYRGVKKLIEFGHKEIGMIRIKNDDISGCKYRYEGYKRALIDSNIEINEDYVAVGDYSFESGHHAMIELLDRGSKISAVFVATDIMAIGATRAILERGLRVPEDISVLGFDGNEFAEYFMPSISTIKQPVGLLGEKSVEILFDLIKGGQNLHYKLDTEFISRESLIKI
ncbi:MAG: LacI family transcriptional regulator [Firmicutes bacterium HGW-Firmicutes-1]|nr:MAG: LacI family transcriptional regulator [Firmicutes bacterium HGW-Firmicutes-1]